MSRRKPLVCQHLENISGTALEEYQEVIREYVRGRHGVYALYRRTRLYYVGLATNLRNRLKHHLNDKHRGKWDRFSVYLTIGDSHLKELESLVLRIVRPKGNTQTGRFAKSEDLKKRLRRDMSALYRSMLDELLGRKRPRREGRRIRLRPRDGASRTPTLSEYVDHPFPIKSRYKRRWYKAKVRRDGSVRYAGRLYTSPSHAAKAVTGRAKNGWAFWLYERAPEDWVRLQKLRQ